MKSESKTVNNAKPINTQRRRFIGGMAAIAGATRWVVSCQALFQVRMPLAQEV